MKTKNASVKANGRNERTQRERKRKSIEGKKMRSQKRMSHASEYNVNANGKSNESQKCERKSECSEASERNANANGKAAIAKTASVKANGRSERTQRERKRKSENKKCER